jgi:hypothetical protein
MLVAVVLVYLREASGGVPALEEGQVVSAPQEPVAAVDHADAHPRGPVLADFLDVAGQLAALRIVLAAEDVAQLRLVGRLVVGYPFGEQADRERLAAPVLTDRASD